MGNIEIFNEDCMELMKRLPDGSVDLILTDPPYGITACKWDVKIDLAALWAEWLRIINKNGVIVITSSQPFTTDLINGNRKGFLYELIWEKDRATNFLNAKKTPLRKHENILVFGANGSSTYNIHKFPSNKKNEGRKMIRGKHRTEIYRSLDKITYWEDDGMRFPSSILKFNHDPELYNSTISNKERHPTQKPLSLFRWIIKTYSNPGDMVFDGYLGSGTTALAAYEEGRRCIGSELDATYFALAKKRIEQLQQQTKMILNDENI